MGVVQVIEDTNLTIYLLDGKLHREDGPALEWRNGDEEWYLYGELSRKDGPPPGPAIITLAFTDEFGNKYYDQEWYRYGKRHNTYGPAIIRFIRVKTPGVGLYDQQWWEDGIRLRSISILPNKTEYRTKDNYDRAGAPAIVWDDGSEEWYSNGKRTRNGLPAVTKKKDEVTLLEEWWSDGLKNRNIEPAVIKLEFTDEDNNKYYTQEWWSAGKLSRGGDQPTVVKFVKLDKNGDPLYEQQWHIQGLLSRVGNPAIVRTNGDEIYYTDDKINRVDGPAVVKIALTSAKGVKYYTRKWYTDGVLTRGGDQPAVIKFAQLLVDPDPLLPDTPLYDQEWYTDEKRNRVGGPAIVKSDGGESWYTNGVLTRGGDKPALKVFAGKDSLGNSLFDRYWYTNGKITRGGDQPAVIKGNGDQEWFTDGKRNRGGDLPAVVKANGDQEWWVNGKRDRTGGPAILLADGTETWITQKPLASVLAIYEPSEVTFTSSQIRTAFGFYEPKIDTITKVGKVHNVKLLILPVLEVREIMGYIIKQKINDVQLTVKKFTDGQVQREGDPGTETSTGRIWYTNGKIDRVGAPAIVLNNGDQFWYTEGLLNRTDGPAVEKANGDQEWYIKGKRSRVGDPAIVLANGTQEWWVNGVLTRFGDLPTKTKFVRYGVRQPVWIKSFPIAGFKYVVKTDVTNNGSYNKTLTWLTTNIPSGNYYYVSELDGSNYGVIKVYDSLGDPVITKTYSVTFVNDKFRLNGIENPLIELYKGDTLVLNIDTTESLFDQSWHNIYNSNTIIKASNTNTITASSTKTLVTPIDAPDLENIAIGSLLYIDSPNPGYVTVISKKVIDPSVNMIVEYYPLNTVSSISWAHNTPINLIERGKLNRSVNPAVIRATGDQEWYSQGLRFRDNINPAIEKANGDKYWYNSYTLTVKTTQASDISPTTTRKINVTPKTTEINGGDLLYIAGSTPGYVVVAGIKNDDDIPTTTELFIKYSSLNTVPTISWIANTNVTLTVKGKLHRVGEPAVIYSNGTVEYWLKGVKQP